MINLFLLILFIPTVLLCIAYICDLFSDIKEECKTDVNKSGRPNTTSTLKNIKKHELISDCCRTETEYSLKYKGYMCNECGDRCHPIKLL